MNKLYFSIFYFFMGAVFFDFEIATHAMEKESPEDHRLTKTTAQAANPKQFDPSQDFTFAYHRALRVTDPILRLTAFDYFFNVFVDDVREDLPPTELAKALERISLIRYKRNMCLFDMDSYEEHLEVIALELQDIARDLEKACHLFGDQVTGRTLGMLGKTYLRIVQVREAQGCLEEVRDKPYLMKAIRALTQAYEKKSPQNVAPKLVLEGLLAKSRSMQVMLNWRESPQDFLETCETSMELFQIISASLSVDLQDATKDETHRQAVKKKLMVMLENQAELCIPYKRMVDPEKKPRCVNVLTEQLTLFYTLYDQSPKLEEKLYFVELVSHSFEALITLYPPDFYMVWQLHVQACTNEYVKAQLVSLLGGNAAEEYSKTVELCERALRVLPDRGYNKGEFYLLEAQAKRKEAHEPIHAHQRRLMLEKAIQRADEARKYFKKNRVKTEEIEIFMAQCSMDLWGLD